MNLLIVPPNTHGYIRDTFYGCWHKPKFINYAWPPLYLLQLKSILKDSQVLDLTNYQVDKGLNIVLKNKPSFVFCNIGTQTLNQDLIFLKKVKEKCDAKIIVFGQHPTVKPKDLLNSNVADICIRGEPENIILQILKNFNNKKVLKSINGVCFKGHITKEKNIIKNLDLLPFPSRKNLNNQHYFNPMVVAQPYTTVLATRGCPYDCTFCTVPLVYGKSFRKRSVDNVISELKVLSKLGYKEIFFRDENLTLDKKYLTNISKKIINQKINLKWICNSRVDTVNKNLLKIMKKSGCHLIKFGVESSNQKTINAYKKKITMSKIIKTFELCSRLGIETLGHFMIGNPGEGREDVLKTVEFAKSLNPTYASFDVLIRYPNTDLGKANLSASELEELHKYAFINFYLRPKYILKNIFLTKSFTQLKNKIKTTFKLWYGLLLNT